jgi:hypothetical protein
VRLLIAHCYTNLCYISLSATTFERRLEFASQITALTRTVSISLASGQIGSMKLGSML